MEQTIEYKGFQIRIEVDDTYMNPDEWGNTDLFLVSDSCRLGIRREGFMEEEIEDLTDGEFDLLYEIEGKTYHVFPIGVHDIVYFTSFSNAHGHIFAETESWADRDSARDAAQALMETWNDCMTNNVWGFVAEELEQCNLGHHHPKHIDSCWGFIGDVDFCIEQAKVAVDAHIESITEEVHA